MGFVVKEQCAETLDLCGTCRSLIWTCLEVVVSGASSGNNFAVLRVTSPLTQGQHQCSLKTSMEVNMILQEPGAIACIFSHSVSVSAPKCPFK